MGLAAFTAVAHAGETYSSKSSNVPIIRPIIYSEPTTTCDCSWFAGGSVGYLTQWEEAMYTLHLGVERESQGSPVAHAFFLDVGQTDKSEMFSINSTERVESIVVDIDDIEIITEETTTTVTRYELDYDIKPITLNYKYETTLSGRFDWYIAAGAGVALVKAELSSSSTNVSFDDTLFYGHVFTGIIYNISPSWETSIGLRYIYMDDFDFDFGSEVNVADSLNNDILINIGAQYNF